jgi:hypothetical protein
MSMTDKIKTREDLCAYIMALPKGWEVTVCTDWRMPEIVGFCNTGDIQEIKRYLEIRIDGPSIVREINPR